MVSADDDGEDTAAEILADRETIAQLALAARSLWDDPEVAVPRDAAYSRDVDEQVVAWAYVHGLLP